MYCTIHILWSKQSCEIIVSTVNNHKDCINCGDHVETKLKSAFSSTWVCRWSPFSSRTIFIAAIAWKIIKKDITTLRCLALSPLYSSTMKSVKNHDLYQAETFAHSLWNLMISRYTKVVHIYPATVSKKNYHENY